MRFNQPKARIFFKSESGTVQSTLKIGLNHPSQALSNRNRKYSITLHFEVFREGKNDQSIKENLISRSFQFNEFALSLRFFVGH